jgi:predicted transcriptional regulator
MKKKTKASVTADGAEGFFRRAREHARKLDRGAALAAEITVTFENVTDMLRVLSAERVRLLHAARQRTPISHLASGLDRDIRAVSRDVDLLESFGLLRTQYESNPGHGRRRVVEPRAARYQLRATI